MMISDERKNKLLRSLSSILDSATVDENGGLGITPSWDSLKHMEICMILERDFSVELTPDSINQAITVSGILQLMSAE